MTKSLEAGDIAPDFSLSADSGKQISLAALKGKKVVLYFYPKDDTSGCTAEAIAFNGKRHDFEAENTIVVGMSPDSVASHVKFKQKHGLEFALAADPEKAVLEAYGVWKEKSMYGRKYMGVERTTFLIDATGKVVQVWRKVKVPGHADEVFAAAKTV